MGGFVTVDSRFIKTTQSATDHKKGILKSLEEGVMVTPLLISDRRKKSLEDNGILRLIS